MKKNKNRTYGSKTATLFKIRIGNISFEIHKVYETYNTFDELMKAIKSLKN